MNKTENSELQLAFEFIQYTNTHVFLTGKAGTGKTTFLHNLKKVSPKRMIVTAPTGVAAINAGGVTIHSFFQMPFGPQVPVEYSGDGLPPEITPRMEASKYHKFSREKINILKSLDLLVIDEISMVRADLLDGIDAILRRHRDRQKPFGGIQLLMIGDIQQLAPVIRAEDWDILKNYYETVFFFGSRALQQTHFVSIELKHIYRQRDRFFIDLLNKIRNNKADADTLKTLNKRYDPGFNPADNEGYIILTTHNNKAQEINRTRLSNLPAKACIFSASIDGDFPEYAYPTEPELTLKTGAQVMFVKNDPSREKRFYNGKIGIVTGIDEDVITVKCPGDDYSIAVGREEWQNMKYSLDEETKEICETVIGTFTQYPLKLAWAITIHKSQGLTFDRAIIDAQAAFAHGQVYVALSRCRTLEGLVLSTPVSSHAIISNETVSRFAGDVEKNAPGPEELDKSKKAYQRMLLAELFNFSPLQHPVRYCLKLLKDHGQIIYGTLQGTLFRIDKALKDEVLSVYEKFSPQLENLIQQQDEIESNEHLQERIMKACMYFHDKIHTRIYTPLENTGFETDNREIRKMIRQALEKLLQHVSVKLTCLSACRDGFNVKRYMEVRAKAAIEPPAVKRSQKKQETGLDDNTINFPSLYREMIAWRTRKALALDLPHYMIMPQKTLISLVNLLPCSIPALTSIKGMGKKKVLQFGHEILTIIQNFCHTNNLTSAIPENIPGMPKKLKEDSKQTSLKLWKTGKTAEEIADERNMAVSTIEGHLAYFVGTGEIKLEHFVPPEKAGLIADYFLQHDITRLAPAKEALGDDVTYSELRYVLKHLEAKGKVNLKS
ncbi:MAG: helix-turn-helix domain-containing protein [Bacteroidales bacterium]|nr:helix-turn-helix domain-containing protein [Bacteroidales bacterium]